MKTFSLFLALSFCTCLSFAQTRNFRLVKAPVENPVNQKRKAMVIGMSDYGSGRSLNNTLNDADDMAEVLTRLGFEVTLLKNNDLRNLRTNLTNWYNTIEGNDMAIFYFAGHGIEVDGQNYLIPVDTEMASQTDVQYSTLNVNQVLGNMNEKRVGMKLLILDACRDNPFSRSWSRSSSEKGLAGMTAPRGTFIAFAASPGYTAHDGGNYNLRNGVFTHFLKQEILKQGASIDEIFGNVSGKVSELTNEQQTPFRNSSLAGNFYFLPRSIENPSPTPTVNTPTVNIAEINRFANFTETAKNLKLEMVAVQGGTFTMGCTNEQGRGCYDDERPSHQVTVSNFYIGKFEITQAQWKAVMGSNPSSFKGDNLPVEEVSWNDVQEFIRKLNALTGKQYRLPTEAEWEFANRGGAKSQGYRYSGSNNLSNVAWYTDNSKNSTQTVGTKSPNELGIYDMSGNVWEWCSDRYGAYSASSKRDPAGASSGSRRVIRGGSWSCEAQICRIAIRSYDSPDSRYYNLGFRVACSSQ